MKDNILLIKNYAFAIRIVRLYQYLVASKHEYVISKQVLRSGTSIGSNAEEAVGGYSKKDFSSKLSISYKEARETHYWIRILRDTDYIDVNQSDSLLRDCEEIMKIITATQNTIRKNNI